MLACVGLVLGFQNTSNLAGTYGVAVTGTMTTTTILFCAVAHERFGWPTWKVVSLGALLLVVDLAFMTANLTKIPHGGWFPLTVAVVIFTLMSTWKRGRSIVTAVLREGSLPMDLFIKDMQKRAPTRVPGVAVFMTSDLAGAPPVLLHHLKHNKVLHEKVVLLSIATREIPQVSPARRIEFHDMGLGICTVVATYGFMESPNVPEILHELGRFGLSAKVNETTFYLGRETLIPTKASPARRAALQARKLWMAMWRKRIFTIMTNNARSATSYFGLPPNRVVELGAQVQL
jgi:KUP system potassium uptake protein